MPEVTPPPKAALRPPVRPDIRAESPLEAARLRAAEIRKHRGPQTDGQDDFRIDESKIPEGWDYEWKRHTVYGQEDPAYQVAVANAGWEPVPASRHPEMMPAGSTHSTILRRGQILMERPKELTEEARQRELRDARRQVRAKEAQLGETPPGTMERDADPRVKPRIKKGYIPMEIPQDE